MKTIGMIAGVTWVSSVEYYRIINEIVNKKLGGHSSAKMAIFSMNCQEETEQMNRHAWEEMANWVTDGAKRVESAGADFLVICSNTIHRVEREVAKKIRIPLLSIIDVTAEEIRRNGLKKVGLIGTHVTMSEHYFINRYKERGVECLVPDAEGKWEINRIIMDELTFRKLKRPSLEKSKEVIEKLIYNGAEGIILGCTELPILIKQKDVRVPIFDTTLIHARAAAELATS
jgi:aspartate racemase